MKFKVSVQDLQYALRTIRDVVPTSAAASDSAGVLISAKGDRAVFTAFNQEMFAKATIRIENSDDGEAVVDALALNSAVNHFIPTKEDGTGTSDVLLYTTSRSKKLHMSAKTRYASGVETPHKRVFALRSQDFFPGLPSENAVNISFELPASILMDGIDSVGYALSRDANLPVFTGMLFKLSSDKLTLFATDGVCLAEYEAPVNFRGEAQKLVIPGSFANKITKSFFEGDTLKFFLTDSMLYVRTANLVLGGVLIREQYPDYKEYFPSPNKYAYVDKHILLDNLLNLNYEAAQAEANRVKIRLEDGASSLFCGQSENGGIPSKADSYFEFDCNLKLFANSVRNVYGDNLKVGFTDNDSLIEFSSEAVDETGPNLTCLIVPLSK